MKRNLRRVMGKALAGAMFVTSSFTGPMSVSAAESDSADVAAVAEAADEAEEVQDSIEVADDSSNTAEEEAETPVDADDSDVENVVDEAEADAPADVEIKDADSSETDAPAEEGTEASADADVTDSAEAPEEDAASVTDVASDVADVVTAEGDEEAAEKTNYVFYDMSKLNQLSESVVESDGTIKEGTDSIIYFASKVKSVEVTTLKRVPDDISSDNIGKWVPTWIVTGTDNDGKDIIGDSDGKTYADIPGSTKGVDDANSKAKNAYLKSETNKAKTPRYAYVAQDTAGSYIRIVDCFSEKLNVNFKTTPVDSASFLNETVIYKAKVKLEELGGGTEFLKFNGANNDESFVINTGSGNDSSKLFVKGCGSGATNVSDTEITVEKNKWYEFTVEVSGVTTENQDTGAKAKITVVDEAGTSKILVNAFEVPSTNIKSISIGTGDGTNRLIGIKDVFIPLKDGVADINQYPNIADDTTTTPDPDVEITGFTYDGLVKIEAAEKALTKLEKSTGADASDAVESIDLASKTINLVAGSDVAEFVASLQTSMKANVKNGTEAVAADKIKVEAKDAAAGTYTVTVDKITIDLTIKAADNSGSNTDTTASGGIMVSEKKSVNGSDPDDLKEGDLVDITYKLTDPANINNYTFFVDWDSNVLELQDAEDSIATSENWLKWTTKDGASNYLIPPELINQQMDVVPNKDNENDALNYSNLISGKEMGADVTAANLGRLKLAGVAGFTGQNTKEITTVDEAGTLFTLRFKMLEKGGTANISLAPIDKGKVTEDDNGIFYQVPSDDPTQTKGSMPCVLTKPGKPFASFPQNQVTGEMTVASALEFEYSNDKYAVITAKKKADDATKVGISVKSPSLANNTIQASRNAEGNQTYIKFNGAKISVKDMNDFMDDFIAKVKADHEDYTVAKDGADKIVISKGDDSITFIIERIEDDTVAKGIAFDYANAELDKTFKVVVSGNKLDVDQSASGAAIGLDMEKDPAIIEIKGNNDITIDDIIEDMQTKLAKSTDGLNRTFEVVDVSDKNPTYAGAKSITIKDVEGKFTIVVAKCKLDAMSFEYNDADNNINIKLDKGVLSTTNEDVVQVTGSDSINVVSQTLKFADLAAAIKAQVEADGKIQAVITPDTSDELKGSIAFTAKDGSMSPFTLNITISTKALEKIDNVDVTVDDDIKVSVKDGVISISSDSEGVVSGDATAGFKIKKPGLTLDKFVEALNEALKDSGCTAAKTADGTGFEITKEGCQRAVAKAEFDSSTPVIPPDEDVTAELTISGTAGDSAEAKDAKVTIEVKADGSVSVDNGKVKAAPVPVEGQENAFIVPIPFAGFNIKSITQDTIQVSGDNITVNYDADNFTATVTINGKEYKLTFLSYGDVDNDGNVNSGDALEIIKVVNKERGFDSIEEIIANLDSDLDNINAGDALDIVKLVNKEITEFEVLKD